MADTLPFNSIDHDRVYKAEDWAWYFATFLANGVFPKPSDGLQVIAYQNMEVRVNMGYAFINGTAFRNPVSTSIKLATAEGAQNRIDRIVVRWDLTERDTYLAVLKGVPSAKPTATELTRNTERWELALADIYVGKGVTGIRAANITDQRYNSAVCGIVKGTVEEIDASVLTKQFNDFFKSYSESVEVDFDKYKLAMETYLKGLMEDGSSQLSEIVKLLTDFEASSEQQWNEWFERIQATLASAENGELLAEILRLINDLYDMATTEDIDRIINDTYAETGNVGGIFEAGTDQDIDDIIAGTYTDDTETEEMAG